MRPVAQIAQSVEQRIENPRVRGSIPRLGTIQQKALQQCRAFLFVLPISPASPSQSCHRAGSSVGQAKFGNADIPDVVLPAHQPA